MENPEDHRSKNIKPPENVKEEQCELCWGWQEFHGELRVLYADKQKDVNNKLTSHVRIQRFIKKYLDGSKLKKGKIQPVSGRKKS